MFPLGVLAGILGSAIGISFGFMGLPAISNLVNRPLNAWLQSAIPDPTMLTAMRYRNLLTREDYEKTLKEWGFSDVWIDRIYKVSRNLATVTELLESWRRGLITDTELERELKNHQFDDKTIQTLKQLAFSLPSPSDIIRFTVREVFNPEIATRFGQFQEFPSDDEIQRAYQVWIEIPRLIEMKEKEEGRPLLESEVRNIILERINKESPFVQMCIWSIFSGVPPEILKMYWGAHWDLPSLTAGYEMLHRLRPELVDFKANDYRKMGLDPEKLKFTLDDLKLLLKAQDVMPFWRDKLVAISYHLPTRVDIRRMLRDGIITEEEAHKYYMMLGYTDKDAWNLVKLAKTMYKEENKELTRSLIMKAYILKEIDREQAKKMLKDIGYSEEDAEFMLKLQDIENAQEELDMHIDALVRQYVYNIISEDELDKKLDQLGLKASRKHYIIELARLEKQRRVRLPSVSTIRRWYLKGYINLNGVKKYMKGLGYDDFTIKNYIKELKELKGEEE